MRVIGVDLAWKEGPDAAETGVVAIDPDGTIQAADWTRGVTETIEWILNHTKPEATLVFVDAPLLVLNDNGQRSCETEVGRHYGPWKVSANSTNLSSPRLAGVTVRRALELHGYAYDDGLDGPPASGLVVSECYPYTTIVGLAALDYDERPTYKRKPKAVTSANFPAVRAAACQELLRRLATLSDADPPLRLDSHAATAALLAVPCPLNNREYKHQEDLLDAVLCAYAAQLWLRHGLLQSQALGAAHDGARPKATIIAPCRTTQRRDPLPVRSG